MKQTNENKQEKKYAVFEALKGIGDFTRADNKDYSNRKLAENHAKKLKLNAHINYSAKYSYIVRLL